MLIKKGSRGTSYVRSIIIIKLQRWRLHFHCPHSTPTPLLRITMPQIHRHCSYHETKDFIASNKGKKNQEQGTQKCTNSID